MFSQLPLRIKRPAALGLFLFSEQQDYMQTLRARFGTDATGSWGMCISNGRTISLAGFRGSHSVEEMKRLLQHEGFHQFAAHLFPDLPRWADEGLAEVFERGVVIGNELVLGEIPALDQQRLLKAVESGQAMPLERLLSIDSRQWQHQVRIENASTQYLQAWALVHFLLFADDGRYQEPFLMFLVQLNANTEWERAFVTSFGWPNLAEMESRWISYFKTVRPTDLRETVRRLDFLAAGMLYLRARNIYPATFSELKAELSKTDFTHAATHFGQETVQVATDDAVYSLPGTNGSDLADASDFMLVNRRGQQPTSRYKSLRAPPPLSITTMQSSPRKLTVRWNRRRSHFTYDVIAVPNGRPNVD